MYEIWGLNIIHNWRIGNFCMSSPTFTGASGGVGREFSQTNLPVPLVYKIAPISYNNRV